MTQSPAIRRRRFAPSLRTKLLLIPLALLVIPWVGYRYVQEMERFLRHGQEEALLATAQAVATVLHEQSELFVHTVGGATSPHVYVRPLTSAIQLDGYAEDWSDYSDRMQLYGGDSLPAAAPLRFRHAVGSHGKYLYAVFEVTDDRLVYRDPNAGAPGHCDQVHVALLDPAGQFQRYALTTSAPGWVNAYRLPVDREAEPAMVEVGIKAEWQETPEGYTIEVRIPLSLLGSRLGFAVVDVDALDPNSSPAVVGTTGMENAEQLATVTVPSARVQGLLQGLEHGSSRIWVVDRQRRVLAQAGSLEQASVGLGENPETGILSGLLHGLYRLILPQPAQDYRDELSGASRMEGLEIDAALEGQAMARWRQPTDRRTTILAAAHPIWVGNEVQGAVIAERTSDDILILQNRAMENLINLSLIVFLAAAAGLLTFASRLSGRVRRLRDATESAIGADGRIRHLIPSTRASDELGDLSRSFSAMLNRLHQYTRYLETMAGKLSHELRTPLAVARSSLDNLEAADLSPEARNYTLRARDGLERLSAILSRMSEATRLERALQHTETEDVDLARLVDSCVSGYRLARPDQRFEFQSLASALPIVGAPDLIAQMLDKLIGNAADFSPPDAAIEIRLERDHGYARLSVLDRGPGLPEHMAGNIFDSMVSVRSQTGGEPHLGLGLYIVRLIAEFHHGFVEAANRSDSSGARFTVMLPLKTSERSTALR